MTKKLWNEAADRGWSWWEENKGFEYKSDWDKACFFADYIDECEDEDLLSIADVETTHDYVAKALRKIINHGIDLYLGNPVDMIIAANKKPQEARQ